MLKKLILLATIIAAGIMLFPSQSTFSSSQDALATFRGNSCVTCHSRSNAQLQVTSRYAEWHMSVHREKGVGCEKCHGGDATAQEQAKAHAGVLAVNAPNSRLHPKNLTQTCGTCHQEIANTFTESKHFQNLKSAGLGPSCSTCHEHMASNVIYTPEQTSTLCASCHDSTNALMPKRPEIPGRAAEVMQSIRRANMVVMWADRLVDDAHIKKVDITAEEKEMNAVRTMRADAKISWHAFNLDVARKKADATFEEGTKVKDALRKKLYPNQ
ncbi:MAG: hypothetical protein JNM09_20500 [Blastocatellia bacterium]|nr:hypothetical protein [Blastocatellia bacterium]